MTNELNLFNEEEAQVASPLEQVSLPKDKDLPPVFRELVSIAPEHFKLPTFIACCAPLGCLATRLRFYYPFDQQPQAVLLQTIICSEQSGGKSFARMVESMIMGRQKLRDTEQRRLEQDYREKKARRKANEKLDEPPKTSIICCPVSISIAQLIKRADAPIRLYGVPLTLWTFTEELATATETNKRAFANIKSIMRTAYDLGSEYGVDYLSDNSYSATVDILYNTMFCTTPSALDEYMDKKAIEGGNVTRTILCDLGSQLGDEAPVFKRLTDRQQERLNATIERMMQDTYLPNGQIGSEIEVDMHWLEKDVRDWCQRKNTEAITGGSAALGVFFKRSSVSAFRIAALCQYLYSLNDEVTKREAINATGSKRKFVRQIYLAMADYILESMLRQWGNRYEALRGERQKDVSNVRPKLFNSVNDAFALTDLENAISLRHLTTPANVFISKWLAKGLIERLSKDSYHKTITSKL